MYSEYKNLKEDFVPISLRNKENKINLQSVKVHAQ